MTLAPALISITPVIIAEEDRQSMRILLTITGNKTIEIQALVDSGAGGIFIDSLFAQKHNIPLSPLETPIRVYNVDNSRNKTGSVTHCAVMDTNIGGQITRIRFLVTGLGHETIILGLPWLKQENPDIDWEKGILTINPSRRQRKWSTSFCKALEKQRIRKTVLETSKRTTTLEEIPDEEPQQIGETLGQDESIILDMNEPLDNPVKEITESELPSFQTTDKPEDITDDDLVISYIQGEPVIGIFKP